MFQHFLQPSCYAQLLRPLPADGSALGNDAKVRVVLSQTLEERRAHFLHTRGAWSFLGETPAEPHFAAGPGAGPANGTSPQRLSPPPSHRQLTEDPPPPHPVSVHSGHCFLCFVFGTKIINTVTVK